MAALQAVDFYRGLVLGMLMDSDRPVTLRLIERNTNRSYSSYKLNDEVEILIKYRTSPSNETKSSISWSFSIAPEQVRNIKKETGKHAVALVCGYKNFDTSKMQVCFLDPDRMEKLLQGLDNECQLSFTVRAIKGQNKQLQLVHKRKVIMRIPKRALKTWSPPGS